MSQIQANMSAKRVSSAANCKRSKLAAPSVFIPAVSSINRPYCDNARPSVRCMDAAKVATVSAEEATKAALNELDLGFRHRQVMSHFPTALGVDDFMARVETVLAGYGFTGENSIAMTNLCRDEVTQVLKDKIEACFGSSFNTNGLGGVLTCGVTGMKAGFSHSPLCSEGKERYVFFAFPHIAINGQGAVGAISRPGRAGASCACGALQACTNLFRAEGYECHCKTPGEHDPLEPELSILKQRLARRLRFEKKDHTKLDLVELTHVCERTITSDLEYLIEKAVDPKKADYAVITGVEIHNWAADIASGAPSMEFVAPAKVFVCVNGEKISLDLSKVPSLSPRQISLLSKASNGSGSNSNKPLTSSMGSGSTLQEISDTYLQTRMGGAAVVTQFAGTGIDLEFQSLVGQGAKGEINRPSFEMVPSMESSDNAAVVEEAVNKIIAVVAKQDAKNN